MSATRSWREVGLPFLVLRVGGQAGEFAAFVALARQLDAGPFGRLSIGFLLARYLGLVADWGASVRGARDVARGDDPSAINSLLRRRTEASALLTVVYAVGAAALAGPEYAPLAAVVAARGLNRDWLSLGRQQGSASGASSVAQGVALFAFALVARTPTAAVFAVAAAYLVGLAVSLAFNRPPSRPEGARDDGVRVDGWILGSVLADQITISADTLLLGWLRSASAAGIYAAVYRIPNAWMTLIGLTVLGMLPGTTWLVVTGTTDDARDLQRQALRVGGIAAMVVLATAIPAYVLVPIVFGDDYRSGRTPLLVLMVATAVMAVASAMHPLYVSLVKDRDVFTLSLGGAAVNLLANAVAIPLWGMVGAASATLATQSVLLVTVLVRLRRRLR